MSEEEDFDEAEAGEVGPTPRAHPRDRYVAEGLDALERAFLEALDRGRLHHAWMIVGPRGLGKSAFAYRAARRLLGAAANPAYGRLGAAPDDPVSRLIAAQAHPDLMVLEPVKRDIRVEDARRLPEFFQKSPAMAGYRVAIVDAAEDLNSSSANALLKTLEEPSDRGVLFLISHAPGRLLPTIRSRCRLERARPWSQDALAAFLTAQGRDPAAAREIASQARGSPGRALEIAEAGETPAAAAALALVAGEAPPAHELQKVADRFRGPDGGGPFRAFMDRLCHEIGRAALDAPSRRAAAWSEAYSRLSALPRRVEAVNLDRGEAFWSAVEEVRSVRSRPC